MATRKLTIKGLERMIREEVAKYEADLEKKARETEEYEAGEEADTLEKHVDHTPDEPKVSKESLRRKNAKLVAEERKLKRQLARVRKQRQSLSERARRRRR